MVLLALRLLAILLVVPALLPSLRGPVLLLLVAPKLELVGLLQARPALHHRLHRRRALALLQPSSCRCCCETLHLHLLLHRHLCRLSRPLFPPIESPTTLLLSNRSRCLLYAPPPRSTRRLPAESGRHRPGLLQPWQGRDKNDEADAMPRYVNHCEADLYGVTENHRIGWRCHSLW